MVVPMVPPARERRHELVHITYDPATQALHVEHASGERVVYERVPAAIYETLRDAPSKMDTLRDHIEGRFQRRAGVDDRNPGRRT